MFRIFDFRSVVYLVPTMKKCFGCFYSILLVLVLYLGVPGSLTFSCVITFLHSCVKVITFLCNYVKRNGF